MMYQFQGGREEQGGVFEGEERVEMRGRSNRAIRNKWQNKTAYECRKLRRNSLYSNGMRKEEISPNNVRLLS